MNIPACSFAIIASLAPLRSRAFRSSAAISSYRSSVGGIGPLSWYSTTTSLNMTSKPNYWNRETSQPTSQYEGAITKEARILALCDPNDAYNKPLYNGPLPDGSKLLAIGSTLADFDNESIINQNPNVIFVSHPKARESLVELLDKFPSVEWVHTRSAGIDFISSQKLFDKLNAADIQLTNAKGIFSSTLAEYCMLACSYFSKDLPRLMRQKNEANWEQYPVLELRGSTLGVVGFGDIGRASAKLAKAYGMKVLGLKRTVPESFSDECCDEIFDLSGLVNVVKRSDYILVSTPLTEQTRGLISKEVLSHCKKTAVIINVGRGPIIDEEALIEALESGDIKGAGLDVMTVEPLPKESKLWKLPNVLLSPHNMDMTLTFMQESTEFFINENLPRFVREIELLNPVDKRAGY